MSHIHVRDKQTGHEYPVAERLFNADAHEKTGKPARDAHGDLVPVKFRTSLGRSATPTPKQAATKAADKSGQKAETEKE